MKKFLVYLFAITLFPAVFALAQDDGRRHGGGNGGGGGWGNSNPSGGDRTGNPGNNGGGQPWNGNQKAKKQRRGGNKLSPKPQGLGNRRANQASNLTGGHSANNPNRGFNSQNKQFNGNGKNGGGKRGNHFQKGKSLNGAQSAVVPARFQKCGNPKCPSTDSKPQSNPKHWTATIGHSPAQLGSPWRGASRIGGARPQGTSNIVQTHTCRRAIYCAAISRPDQCLQHQ